MCYRMGKGDSKNDKRTSSTNNRNPPKKLKQDDSPTTSDHKRTGNQKPSDPRRHSTAEQNIVQV